MASKTGVGIILAIALVFFVATIVWFVCKEAVKLCLSSAWSPANCLSRVARTTSTGVASNVNEHQTQSATAASNATVVEIEHDTPFPPDVPPPYSSLYFQNSLHRAITRFAEILKRWPEPAHTRFLYIKRLSLYIKPLSRTGFVGPPKSYRLSRGVPCYRDVTASFSIILTSLKMSALTAAEE